MVYLESMLRGAIRMAIGRLPVGVPIVLIFLAAGCQGGLRLALGVAEIEPDVLRDRLAGNQKPLLLDLRRKEDFRAGHIPSAVSLDIVDVDGYLFRLGPPRERPVVTICYGGTMSLVAAATVASHGYVEVHSLRGGMARWNKRGFAVEQGAGEEPDPGLLVTPVLRIDPWEQFVIAATGLAVKPAYMVLALFLILVLRRNKSRELVLLRRSLWFFLLGEAFCAVNYAAAGGFSITLELAHGAGMIVMNALLPWGLFALLDLRVLRFSDAEIPCAAIRFCGQCWKREDVSCGLQRLFLFAAPALALVALMPLAYPLHPLNVIMPVFGTDVPGSVDVFLQMVEFRLYPVLACLLMLVTFLLLLVGKKGIRLAQLPFFAGFGFMTFSLFRFFLLQSYRSMPGWGDAWEELTEFIVIAALALLLIVFRRPLGLFARASNPDV